VRLLAATAELGDGAFVDAARLRFDETLEIEGGRPSYRMQ
jgi:hypothetical protein